MTPTPCYSDCGTMHDDYVAGAAVTSYIENRRAEEKALGQDAARQRRRLSKEERRVLCEECDSIVAVLQDIASVHGGVLAQLCEKAISRVQKIARAK